MSDPTPISGEPAPTPTPTGGDPTPTNTDISPLVNNDGGLDPNWHMRLGGDLQVPENMQNVKDIQTIIKGSIEGQAMIGKMGTEIGNLKKQMVESVGMGAPETAGDYSFTRKPEGMEEGDWNQDMADKWSEIFKENDIGDLKASAIVERFGEFAKTSVADNQAAELQAQNVQVDALKNEWGPRYDENLEKAINTAKKLGLDIDNPQIGNNITLITALHKISDSVSESVIQGAGPGNSVGLETNQGARAEARDIIQNPDNPDYKAFHDPGHQMHEKVNLKVDNLNMQHSKMMGRQ